MNSKKLSDIEVAQIVSKFDSNKFKNESPFVFIIGCSRSGTNWLGYILKGHSGTHVTIEQKGIFKKVGTMAHNALTKKILFPLLINRYLLEKNIAGTKLYVDKSHQNIWLVE